MTMNIVHIADSMEVGGAETLIAELCRLQRTQGHDPSIHCLYANGVIGKVLELEGFEVKVHCPPTFVGLARSLYRAFRRSTPDVVHCHNATTAIIGTVPARIAGVKSVVVTRHGLVAAPYLLRRELKFAAASRLCDWVIAVCEEARQNLVAAPFAARNRIVRVYNGGRAVNTNVKISVSKIGFTLLHVGRLSPAKDQESLLRAFASAKRDVPDLQLWIVGDGPLRVRLRELAGELGIETATRFFGEQTELAPFYVAADLFVMSSVTEGLPIALLEAMSAGLPAIVTNVGGMKEIAQLSTSVMAVAALDSKVLADAIRRATQNRHRLAGMRAAARECYEKNFTLERMGDEYSRLYEHPHHYSSKVSQKYAFR